MIDDTKDQSARTTKIFEYVCQSCEVNLTAQYLEIESQKRCASCGFEHFVPMPAVTMGGSAGTKAGRYRQNLAASSTSQLFDREGTANKPKASLAGSLVWLFILALSATATYFAIQNQGAMTQFVQSLLSGRDQADFAGTDSETVSAASAGSASEDVASVPSIDVREETLGLLGIITRSIKASEISAGDISLLQADLSNPLLSKDRDFVMQTQRRIAELQKAVERDHDFIRDASARFLDLAEKDEAGVTAAYEAFRADVSARSDIVGIRVADAIQKQLVLFSTGGSPTTDGMVKELWDTGP